VEPFVINLAFSAAIALLATWFGWNVWRLLYGKRKAEELGFFEMQRRITLREQSGTYRYFEPLIDDIVTMMPDESAFRQLHSDLQFQTDSLPWTAREFLAARYLEGILAGVALAVFFGFMMGVIPAVIVGAIAGWGYPEFMKSKVTATARERRTQLKRRLPFAIDLIALMMEAGASFLESAETVVTENPDHPLAMEFQRVISRIERGEPRRDAFMEIHERVEDDEVRDLISAINQAEELGTPLARIFRDQADQMRLKRSQWAEKAAADAQVKITGPGMLIALACMVIVLAPFLLNLQAMF